MTPQPKPSAEEVRAAKAEVRRAKRRLNDLRNERHPWAGPTIFLTFTVVCLVAIGASLADHAWTSAGGFALGAAWFSFLGIFSLPLDLPGDPT